MAAEIAAHKVLVVDDDEVIHELMAELLREHISVSFANNGPKALELARIHQPDLILLDVMMPGMDGFEVCQKLKADPQTKDISVVFLTAVDDEECIAAGFKLGAIDYITKPYNPEIVISKVKNLIGQLSKGKAAGGARGKRGSDKDEVKGLGNGRRTDASNGRDRRTDASDSREHRAAPSSSLLGKYGTVGVMVVVLAVVGYGIGRFLDTPPTQTDAAAVTAPKASGQVPSSGGTGRVSSTSRWPGNSKCGDIPMVPWWGTVTKSTVVRYVALNHKGDWQPYIDKWERQAKFMSDVLARGSSAITKDGTSLQGDNLRGHIENLKKRVSVIRCLSREAAKQP